MTLSQNQYAVILAGGAGTRLWPVSRTLSAKQFHSFGDEKSLLQQSFFRLLASYPAERIFTVTSEDLKFEVKGQAADVNVSLLAGVVTEPVAKNTLPAITLAVKAIISQCESAVISVFPADHIIQDQSALVNALALAQESCLSCDAVVLGITPDFASPDFGYVRSQETKGDVRDVLSFTEKPDLATAQTYLKQGGYFWNAGIYVFAAQRFQVLVRKYQPDIARIFTDLTVYPNLPAVSIDYGLTEKLASVRVVPVAMGWSDLGNWESIYRHLPKDTQKNVKQGSVVALDSSDNILWSDGRVLATLGIKGLVVVQTPDATLVVPRSELTRLKELTAQVARDYPQVTHAHVQSNRPWGSFVVLEETSRHKIKRIRVKQGGKLSLQEHSRRNEHWVVVSGRARVTCGDRIFELGENQSTYIPAKIRHRLENIGDSELEVVEVQCGEYVGEDDIIRFEDLYERR